MNWMSSDPLLSKEWHSGHSEWAKVSGSPGTELVLGDGAGGVRGPSVAIASNGDRPVLVGACAGWNSIP